MMREGLTLAAARAMTKEKHEGAKGARGATSVTGGVSEPAAPDVPVLKKGAR
jgi:hypothetical protein